MKVLKMMYGAISPGMLDHIMKTGIYWCGHTRNGLTRHGSEIQGIHTLGMSSINC
jgi:hypothetical protein